MDPQSNSEETVAPAANVRAELRALETAALNLIESILEPIIALPPIQEEAVAVPPAEVQPNNEAIQQDGFDLQANETNAVQVIPEQVVQVPVQAGRPNLPVPIDIFRDYTQPRRRRGPRQLNPMNRYFPYRR